MMYKKLYKENSDGSTQVWAIHRELDNTAYYTVSGKLDGKMVISAHTAVTPKVNRSQKEQILLEMDSKINIKQRKKYVEDLQKIGQKADAALPGYSAMLAKKWPDQKKMIGWPCLVQPKLDGVRCLATKDGFFTRGRKVIEACQHIRDALAPFFKKNPNAQLDGELYTHEFKDQFEKIVKAVRKQGKRVTPEDLKLQARVQYHVYDAPRIGKLAEKDPFTKRYEALQKALKGIKHIVVVDTRAAANEDDIQAHNTFYIEEGYEGLMIRNRNMFYEGKRTANLLKMKEFDEEEFEIIGVNEGKGGLAGHAGTFQMKKKDGTQFKAKLKGSFERLKWIFNNPKEVIGKMATVRYQGMTNKENVPRFPVAKDVRGMKNRSDWL